MLLRGPGAERVILVLFHHAICFQLLLFWFLKRNKKKKKDKSHQAEIESMNQTSSFPANDEVLDVSVQHMLGQFSWTVPGKKKIARLNSWLQQVPLLL